MAGGKTNGGIGGYKCANAEISKRQETGHKGDECFYAKHEMA